MGSRYKDYLGVDVPEIIHHTYCVPALGGIVRRKKNEKEVIVVIACVSYFKRETCHSDESAANPQEIPRLYMFKP